MAAAKTAKLELTFDRPEDLLARLYPNGQLGGMFFDGLPPVALGAKVELTLRVTSPSPRHFNVHTQLAWVRHRLPRQKEGFGLDFLPEDAKGRERLVAFASGKALDEPIRAEERLSVALEVLVMHNGAVRKETLADLSQGGAYLRTKTPLAPGTDVEVSLRPPLSLRRLRLRARVAWTKKRGDDAGMGLQFIYADARQQDRLRRLLERIGQKRG